MQCFICVTYMFILCSANPTKPQDTTSNHEKRSLFHDVIESLRIRSQLSEDIKHNDENHLSQNYEGYGYENELSHLPSDSEYIPRRNDRIEMPSLKYRYPRNIYKSTDKSKGHVVLYIDTHTPIQTSQRPKTDKTRQQPHANKPKYPYKIKENETGDAEEDRNTPSNSTMAGQSQFGNRDSQTVIKPTVIVNIRGSVSNRENDIKLEATSDDNSTVPLQNIFNINQEVNIGTDKDKSKNPAVSQEIRLMPVKGTAGEGEIMICETAKTTADDESENISQSRKFDVLQILFAI